MMIIIICLCSPNSEASALSSALSFEIQQTFIGHPLVWSRGMLDLLKSEGIYIEGLGPVELDLPDFVCLYMPSGDASLQRTEPRLQLHW